MFDESLKKWFGNRHQSTSPEINKFVLLLERGVYPYKHMSDWEKFKEKSSPKDDCCSNLNLKDIAKLGTGKKKEFVKLSK